MVLFFDADPQITPVPSSGATPVKYVALVFCEELNGAGGAGADGKL